MMLSPPESTQKRAATDRPVLLYTLTGTKIRLLLTRIGTVADEAGETEGAADPVVKARAIAERTSCRSGVSRITAKGFTQSNNRAINTVPIVHSMFSTPTRQHTSREAKGVVASCRRGRGSSFSASSARAETVFAVESVGLLRPAGEAIADVNLDPPFHSARIHQRSVAVTRAVRSDGAAVEFIDPEAVERGIEESFAEVHVAEHSVARLQVVLID